MCTYGLESITLENFNQTSPNLCFYFTALPSSDLKHLKSLEKYGFQDGSHELQTIIA